MSFKKISKIPSQEEIKEILPLNKNLQLIKKQNDDNIKNIICGKSDKKIVIIGPCSADSEKSICEYLEKLLKIKDEVKSKLFLVPRVYTSKPRTTGDGYKGMIHQPNINNKPTMKEGILSIRKLDIKIINDYSFPIADEMLYTSTYPYIDDLLSYVAIGARSVENQHHRLISSGIDCAVGMKNPMSSDISVMLNAINTAQKSHNFIYDGYEVNTSGNSFAHSILRGGVNLLGEHFPNYHYDSLLNVANMYKSLNLVNPAIIVDTNHSNSGKLYYKQPSIALDVVKSMDKNKEIKNIVKGFMIESYLKEGSDPSGKTYGKSITDACISIETTRELLLNLCEKL